MAISFASIGSHSSNGRYSLVKADQLNPADRAYLDECRRGSRNSATGVRCFDGMGLGGGGGKGGDSSARKCHLQPHPLANGKQSINPYHESFRAAQAQLLQQRIQLKKGGSGSAGRGVRGGGFGSGKWTWKRTLLLTAVIAVLVGTFIVIACVKAENYQNGDYVRFFSALIPAILLASLAFVLLSKLAPWIREKRRRRQRKDEEEAKEAVEVEKSTTEDLETAGEATTTVAEEASSAVMVNWADKKEAEDNGTSTTVTAAKEIV